MFYILLKKIILMDERLYYKEIVYNMCLGSIEEEKGGQKMKKYVLGNVLRLFSYILKGIDEELFLHAFLLRLSQLCNCLEEYRIGHIHALAVSDHGIPFSNQSCNGKCHGDSVIQMAVDMRTF